MGTFALDIVENIAEVANITLKTALLSSKLLQLKAASLLAQ
jgi:hypothetical protein